jgi:septal ring factor EnvC (AmiA/AmiB activator)
MKKLLFSTLFFLASFMLAFAQLTDRTELERERKEIQDELKEIQGAYNTIKGQTKQSLGQLNMLSRKINLQERYISSINKELKYIDDDIYLSNLEIYRLQRQLDTLKTQYARTVVYAYKNRSSYDYVNFIFSAGSFNDALRRIAYLKSYRAYREKQVNTINETQQLIAKRQQQQMGRKVQKSTALETKEQERVALAEQKKEKDVVVSKLKSQEKDLAKQLAAKKKRDKDLKNAIAAAIRRDIEAAKKESERIAALRKAEDAKNKPAVVNTPAATPGNKPVTPVREAPEKRPDSYLELNAKDVALGAEFVSNKGKLPWPVDRAIVTIPFGDYNIPGTNLRGNNTGITLAVPSVGAPVKAVFDGVVSAIHNYGDGVAIVVRHGKYYSSYYNLSGVNVSKGATVKTGQVIGKAGEAEEGGGGQVDFMLMMETNPINPSPWLRR